MERRTHPRFVSQTKVEIGVLDQRPEILWTTNISKGGMFIATLTPPLLGTRVDVRLSMWGGGLTLRAVVVHRAAPEVAGMTPGVGVEFTELDRSKRARIDAYIAGEQTDAHHEREFLRKSWLAVFPDRVARAERMVVDAIELENGGEEDEAGKLLADAIELDPFNQALAVLADAWKR